MRIFIRRLRRGAFASRPASEADAQRRRRSSRTRQGERGQDHYRRGGSAARSCCCMAMPKRVHVAAADGELARNSSSLRICAAPAFREAGRRIRQEDHGTGHPSRWSSHLDSRTRWWSATTSA